MSPRLYDRLFDYEVAAQMRDDGMTCRQIASVFGVTEGAIAYATRSAPPERRVRWRHAAVAWGLPAVERFQICYGQAEITSTGCVLWPRSTRGRYGYGQFAIGEKHIVQAHRMSMHVFRDMPLDSPLCVLHRCDVPSCINPDHLFLGTKTDNAADRERKGRTAKGEQRATKLTTADVIEIREMYLAGSTHREIAEQFGCCREHVGQVVRGQSWAHV
jgi:hypothetical protein